MHSNSIRRREACSFKGHLKQTLFRASGSLVVPHFRLSTAVVLDALRSPQSMVKQSKTQLCIGPFIINSIIHVANANVVEPGNPEFSTISWLARPFSLAVFCIADLNQQRVPDDQCRENKIIVLATPSLGSLTWLKVAAVSGFGSNDSRGVAHKRPKLCCPYSLVRTGRVKLSSEHTWLNSPVTFTWKHLTVLIHQTL